LFTTLRPMVLVLWSFYEMCNTYFYWVVGIQFLLTINTMMKFILIAWYIRCVNIFVSTYSCDDKGNNQFGDDTSPPSSTIMAAKFIYGDLSSHDITMQNWVQWSSSLKPEIIRLIWKRHNQSKYILGHDINLT
jgi:hypothetical protein